MIDSFQMLGLVKPELPAPAEEDLKSCMSDQSASSVPDKNMNKIHVLWVIDHPVGGQAAQTLTGMLIDVMSAALRVGW